MSWSTHLNSLYFATDPPVLRLQKTFEHFVPTEIFQYFPSADNFCRFSNKVSFEMVQNKRRILNFFRSHWMCYWMLRIMLSHFRIFQLRIQRSFWNFVRFSDFTIKDSNGPSRKSNCVVLWLRPTLKKLNCVICEIVFFSQSQFRNYRNFRNSFYNPGFHDYFEFWSKFI